mgnify:CR=1 FL=1
MLDAATPTREQILAQLMQWLPGVYRTRDPQAERGLPADRSLMADEPGRRRGPVPAALPCR